MGRKIRFGNIVDDSNPLGNFVANFDWRSELTQLAMKRQLMAMPCDEYLIRLIHHASRKALPGRRLWTAGQLTAGSTVKFLRAQNRAGYDVYFQPFVHGRNAGYILVDLDTVQPAVLNGMVAEGHQPCVVTETSPGHLQAWVRVSAEPLAVPVATAIARQLAVLYHADRGSADGCHLGRLAGFTNQKPRRRLPTGLAPWVKVRQAVRMLASQGPALVEAATRLVRSPGAVSGVPKAILPCAPSSPSSRDPVCHSVSLARAATLYQTWMQRLRIPERFPNPDWSIADLWIAKELIRYGMPTSQVKSVLQLASPDFPRSHFNPEDYLRRTLQRAASELCCHSFPARNP